MEIFVLLMIFIIGTVFGSFFTLAVYRIPLGKNITHERSFCPKCNHRLEFLDLIPVFSYIFLKGKCRYCSKKVRPRYLILETLSGIVFVLAYISMKINIQDIANLYIGVNTNRTLEKLIYLLAFICFYITNALIIGIDKEYKNINKKVLIFGIITQTLYMLYLYIVEKINIYRYGIYLIIMFILCMISMKNKGVGVDGPARTNGKTKTYIIQNLIYLTYIMTFINNLNILFIVLLTTICVFIDKNKKSVGVLPKGDPKKQQPIGFYLGISSIIIVLIQNFIIM